MTTETGGGDALRGVRERLVRDVAFDERLADAILAAIAAAGYEIVPAERMDRLRDVAFWAREMFRHPLPRGRASGHELTEDKVNALQPGDLDPVVPTDGAR